MTPDILCPITDIEVGCLLGEHWRVAVDDSGEEAVPQLAAGEIDHDEVEEDEEALGDQHGENGHGGDDDDDPEPEVPPPKRKKRSSGPKRGKKKSSFGRPDSDSDTDEEIIAVEAEPTIATVSLGGRVRKQTQHFQPQPVPKTKKSGSKAGSRRGGGKNARGGRGRGRGRGRGKGRARAGRGTSIADGKGKAKTRQKRDDKPSKPTPKMETRWKTHAIGLDELEALLFSDGLNLDVATMIKEVWLPEGQQKMKQRQRQSRRVNAQLKALSFGDSGGFGDPLGVQGQDESSGGGRRRRTAVNYNEAVYDQQINEAIRESNREYRRGGDSSASPPAEQPARKRGMRTTRQGRGKIHPRATFRH